MDHAFAVTTTGVTYNTGTTILSGVADTSYINTIMNALMSYIAMRLMGLNMQNSWAGLGLYGGDDGLNNIAKPKYVERVANKLGYRLKVEEIKAGHPVPFLGRIFLDPWSMDASICDVPRRIRSLHLTSAPKTVPDNYILTRKAESYLITDPNTPIVCEWSQAILRILGPTVQVARYEPYIKNDLPYVINAKDGWTPPTGMALDFARQHVCALLETSLDKANKLIAELRRARALSDITTTLTPIVKVVVPAVVGGQILHPPKPVDARPSPNKNQGVPKQQIDTSRQQRRRHYTGTRSKM